MNKPLQEIEQIQAAIAPLGYQVIGFERRYNGRCYSGLTIQVSSAAPECEYSSTGAAAREAEVMA